MLQHSLRMELSLDLYKDALVSASPTMTKTFGKIDPEVSRSSTLDAE